MRKKYCMNCGREMEEGATFCPYCGEKDGYIAAEKAYEEEFQESGSNGKKGGFPKWVIAILVILFVVIVAAVVLGFRAYKTSTGSATDTESEVSVEESVQPEEDETVVQDVNEPNEVPDSAVHLNEGDTVTGYLESASDVDYYMIKAEADGKAKITFQHAANAEQSSVGWRLNYTDDGTISTKLCWMNSDTTEVTMNVSAGENYFYISADSSVGAEVQEIVKTTPYYISVKITEVEAEHEAEEETEEEEEAETTKKMTGTSGGYILPDSSSRYLSASEVSGLSKNELRLARNEIYARHGRLFDDEELQAYFDSKSWYNGTISAGDFKNSMLSEVEKKNIELIKSYE